jgi:hypothetical protein
MQTILHVGLRFSQRSVVDPTLATILGRKGRTRSDYARDHAALCERAANP